MATGIISSAADLIDLTPLAWALLGLNSLIFILLSSLTIIQLFVSWRPVRDEFHRHQSAPAFFTIVAGTSVLGTEMVVVAGRPGVGAILWYMGIALWLIMMYSFFTIMTIAPTKPPIRVAMNSTWMLIVVATQSVSILGTLLAHEIGVPREIVLGFAIVLYLIGSILYILLFSFLLHRFLFLPVDPVRLTPPYWINMGAVAITTLSGSLLIIHAGEWEFLLEVLPFLKGFTLLFWSTATWWVPLILTLGVWRHLSQRVPIRFDLQSWSMVFPLGMYSVATFRLGEAIGWGGLEIFARIMGYLALAAWAIVALGSILHWRSEVIRG